MILPASYLNGFAPRDGQPLYPSLWTGCVGAWNPGLGPSGLTLRDWSGRGIHGVLTNGPTWTTSGGSHALSMDGSNDVVVVPANNALNLTSGITVAAWIYPTAVGGGYKIICCKRIGGAAPTACNYQLNLHTTAGALEWYDLTERISSYVPPLNNWTLVGGTVTAAGRLDLWANGISVYNTTGISQTSNAAELLIGARPLDYSEAFLGRMGEVRVYNRPLLASEWKLLNSRRGIAYEMAPRRRSQAQVTTNRLRRALIGS